jgi:hypothetical protein
MINLGMIIVMLAPQILAGRRRYGPAAHLTLLLFSLVAITAFFVFAPLAPPEPLQTGSGDLNLTYLGFSAIGLAGLVPLFWALEQMFPTYDFTIATVIAQVLGPVLTACLLLLSRGSAMPSLLEWAALGLVVALYGVGLHVVSYGKMK